MSNVLEGKVAIVTGGSRGIGRAIAAALLQKGVHVAISGINKDHLETAEAELTRVATGGARVLIFTADVRDQLAVQSLIDETARRQGGGFIINISSLAGSNPFVGGVSYCASKAAVDAFSEALMQEVRHDGIRVSCIKPGSVNTDFMGHADPENDWKLRPEDVAQVVIDLVSHERRSLPSRVDMRPSRPPRK